MHKKLLFFALIHVCTLNAALDMVVQDTVLNNDWTPCAYANEGVNETTMPQTTVMDSVISTLDNHYELKALQDNRDVAIHELRSSRAGWGPSIDVTAKAGTSRLSTATTRDDGVDDAFYGATRVGAVLVQPIWDGNETCGRVLASESLLDAVNHRIMDNANSLALEGIIAHVDLLWRQKTLELAEENVTQHDTILRDIKERARLGADTIGEVSQTEGRLSRAMATRINAQTSLRQGENNYVRLTKMPVVPVNLAPVPKPSIIYKDPTDALIVAQNNNPKIQSHLAEIQQAKGEKQRIESALYPSFSIEASPYYENRGGNDTQWSSNVDVMGVMRWNIFNSGADLAATKAADARIREARQEAFNIKDTVDLELQNTWTDYQEALGLQRHYTETVKQYTITRDAYLDQFTVGRRSLLDVLDAEAELFNASTQLVTAQSNVTISSYKMLALTGMLLEALGIDGSAYLHPERAEERANQHASVTKNAHE